VVDVDWSVEAPESRLDLRVDRDRVANAGECRPGDQTLALALSGAPVG
jgi:hypothetical protein